MAAASSSMETEMEVDDNSFENYYEEGHQKRLHYILRQAEIYAHFMSKGDGKSPQKDKNATVAKNSKYPRRKNQHDESIDEEEATATKIRFDQTPNYINGEMRDYQLRGLNWLISLHENNINGILADEMGLGKTLQTISMIGFMVHYQKNQGPYLVICPKSTFNNWFNEFKRFCPSVNAITLIGDETARTEIFENMKNNEWHVCVTTYDICLLAKTKLKRFKWQYLVVDEAQRMKNENNKLSKTVRQFKSANRLLLTGTPLQNSLHELWALLNFLLPDVFTSADDFDTWFDSDDCLRGNDQLVKRLHSILKPFMLRRIKSEVEKTLLPKKEVKLFVGLTPLQREVYKKVLLKELTTTNPFGEKSAKSVSMILMDLRKVANHPYLIDEIEPGPPFITDESLITSCGKMMVLDKLLAKLEQQGSRVLLFSQFVIMLNILEDYLIMRGYEYRRLDGDTSYDDRAKDIDEFNAEDSNIFIYMLSTKAGGLGINLASADAVIVYDSDWNPQVDIQAIDRAHRIGQQKQVRVFRLVTENTVDERIIQRAEIKLRLDKIVIRSGQKVEENGNQITKETKSDTIRFGIDKIMSGEIGDTIDVDIDEVLKCGEEKTAKEQAEYDKLGENELRKLTLEEASATTVYEFEGMDFRTMKARKDEEIASCYEFRERRQRWPVNYYDNQLPAEPKPKLCKFLVLQEYQFYPRELRDMCVDGFRLDVSDDLEDLEEKNRLLSQGFHKWTIVDVRTMIDAIAHTSRNNYDAIAAALPHKTMDDIIKYHDKFWERGENEIEDFAQLIRPITLKESQEYKANLNKDALAWKASCYKSNPGQLGLTKYVPKDHYVYYTPKHDRHLICALQKFGLDTPDLYMKILLDIRKSMFFSRDYFITSRTPEDIKARCDIILSIIAKEYKKEMGN